MDIELKSDEHGLNWLESPDTVDYQLHIDLDCPASPAFAIDLVETQQELEQAFVFAEKYQCKRFYFVSHPCAENTTYCFKELPYIQTFKSLDFDFFGKKITLNVLPEGCDEIKHVTYLRLTSSHPVRFNQYLNFTQLKKLFVTYHKSSSGWLSHEGLVDLTIRKYKADDLTGLSNLKSLKRLSLLQGSVKSLNGIEHLKHLETLEIYSVRNLTDLTALLNAPHIENLIIKAYSKVTDWNFLSGMKQLKFLYLEKADSIEFFNALPNLVVAGVNKIEDNNRAPEERIFEQYEESDLPDKQRAIATHDYHYIEDYYT